MALGPGRYDAECTLVRERTSARAVIVIVIEGDRGNGMSCQGDIVTTMGIADVLESVARQIRETGPLDTPLMEAKRKAIDEAARLITQELTDRGLLVEAGFALFAHYVIAKDAPAIQVDEMRLAWMAGAEHLFSSIMNVMEEGAEPTDADMRRMDLIHAELETWRAKIAARAIKTAGSA